MGDVSYGPAPAVPRVPAEVTGAWVRACLGADGRAEQPEADVERIGEGYGLSSVLLRVRLADDHTPPSVVVKLWSTENSTAAREAQVLRTFGGRLGPRVPACYHAAVDEHAGRAVLVLEDLFAAEQGDCLESLSAGPAAQLAGALAALHGTWWRSEELATTWLAPSPWLGLPPDWFAPRRARLLERFGDRLDEPARRWLDRIEEVYARALARLAPAAVTLLHDDLHLDNVLVDRATAEPVLLDWARAATGPAVLDLAELLVAVATPASTDAVLTAYRSALRDRGVPDADLADLEPQVAAAVVVSLTKLTCGVAHWMPASPRESRMIDLSLERAQVGLAAWQARAPELLGLRAP